jgi:hypothetical protein
MIPFLAMFNDFDYLKGAYNDYFLYFVVNLPNHSITFSSYGLFRSWKKAN